MMIDKDYKDNNQAWDHIAEVLEPTIYGDPREALAKKCIQHGMDIDMQEFHPEASHILEMMAIRLIGQTKCNEFFHKQFWAVDAEGRQA